MRKTKKQRISRRQKNHKGRYSRKHRGGQTPNPYIPAVSTTSTQQPFTLNSLSNWFIRFGNKLKEGAKNITAKARQEWQKGVQLVKNAQAQQQQPPQPLPSSAPTIATNIPPPLPNPVQNAPPAAPNPVPIQVGNTTTAYGGKRRRRRRTRKRRRHRSR